MKKTRFSETKIVSIIKSVRKLCGIVKIYPQAGTLREQVSEKVRQALRAHMDMISKGVDKMTADELRLDIVAPAGGMGVLDENREQLINEEMFEKIMAEVMGHEIT